MRIWKVLGEKRLFVVIGALSLGIFTILPAFAISPPSTDTLKVSEVPGDSSLDLEAEPALIDSIEGEALELSGLSGQEKMDSAAFCLQLGVDYYIARDSANAELYFRRALEIILDVDENDPGLELKYYEKLKQEIEHQYENFLTEVQSLPEESSPITVMAGIELIEGDSTGEENGLFEFPELPTDTLALDSLLNIKIQLPPVPVTVNIKVERAIQFFQGKGRKVFTRWLERSGYYVPLMQSILKEQGLPEELVYLSMIESGFNPHAYSYARACGPWQFIRSTGKIFGLKIDWWYDERRDPLKSTYSACRYLKKLYLEFNDWYLALAAYNCGEGKIERHIRKYKTRDYWKLNRLPRQTKNYVPTFLAAMIIAQNPVAYGFEATEFLTLIDYDSVLVTECLDLNLVATILDTTYDYLKQLNPHIVRWCTPPTQDSIWLRIPEGKTEQFYTEVAKIAEDQKRSWVRHRVRRGETLSTIAQKYGVTMNAIKDLKENRIGYKNRIHTGQYLLVPVPAHKYIPGSGEVEVEVRTVIPVSEGKEKIIYIVRSGDNLSTIAEKYHTSVNAIRRWNNLESRNLIRAGQKLVIWSDEVVEIPVTSSAIPNSAVTKQTHIVRSGETLGSIAQKYGLSLESLKKINDLNDPGLIHPGDIIKLYNDSDSALVTEISGELLYTVKQGDTLWEIAETYKISLSALKRHNNFRDGSVIKPGDKIKIPVRQ